MGNSKAEIYLSISKAVLKLEVEKGHLRWKMTDLSRCSGVQRSLIYYYFGKSKIQILSLSLQQLHEDPPQSESLPVNIAGFVLAVRKRIQQEPYLLQFYLKWRSSQTEIGEGLRKFENQVYHRLGISTETLKGPHREMLSALILGLMTTPDVSIKTAIFASSLIEEKILKLI